MSLRCLPNNCAMEEPALEYVLTSHSPKVRQGCVKEETGKGMEGATPKSIEPPLLCHYISLVLSTAPLSFLLLFIFTSSFPFHTQPFVAMYTLSFEKLYLAGNIRRESAVRVLKMWSFLSCLAEADVTTGVAEHVRDRFDISPLELEEPVGLVQSPHPHVR